MSPSAKLTALIAALAISVVAEVAQAQDRNQGRDGEQRPRFGEMLQRLDKNSNGVLEPAELRDESATFVRNAAREAKLDLSRPIPMDRIREAMREQRQRMREREEQGQDRQRGENRDRGNREGGNRNGGSASEKPSAPATTSLVPGFGLPTDMLKTPGFDTTASATTPSASSAGASASAPAAASTTAPASASGPPNNPGNDQLRRYAESLIKQYDANKNGKLERDEWKTISGEPGKGDTNSDGVLTVEELMAWFGNRNKSGPGGPAATAKTVTPSSDTGTASTTKSKRFLMPAERLPQGLPLWFARNDANSDGQVSMNEYSATWNDAKAEEFNKYDLNRDGAITAAECLKVDGGAKKK